MLADVRTELERISPTMALTTDVVLDQAGAAEAANNPAGALGLPRTAAERSEKELDKLVSKGGCLVTYRRGAY